MIVLDSTERFVAILSWIFKDLPFIGRDRVTSGCVAKALHNPEYIKRVEDGYGLCFWICWGFSGDRRKMNLAPLEEQNVLPVPGFTLCSLPHGLWCPGQPQSILLSGDKSQGRIKDAGCKTWCKFSFSNHWIRLNLERVGERAAQQRFRWGKKEDSLMEQFSSCFSFDIFYFCWILRPLSSPVLFKFLRRVVLSAQSKAWFKSWQPDF